MLTSMVSRRRQWHPTPVLVPGKSYGWRSLVGSSPWGREESGTSRAQLSDFTFTFHFHALEKEMATHSSVLAWRIPGTEEPSGLLSMGSHWVGHDWSDLAAAAAAAAAWLVIIKKSDKSKFWQGCGEIVMLIYCWGECKMVSHPGNRLAVPQIVKYRVQIWSGKPMSRYLPKRTENRHPH